VEGWSSFAVEQCCDILDSMRVPVNAEDRDKRIGEIPYYGANGLQGYIDDFIFDEPLILIAEDGGYFDEFATRPIAYRIKGKSWVNNHAHVLRAKEAFCQDAVFYNLEHKDIQSFIVGGTRSKLNQVALRTITLTLPTSKIEQTKIAEILLTVDRAIEQTEALIAKQQRIKTGLMQDLLTRGIDEHGNLRTEKNHKFKDSPLGRIPVEWEVEGLNSRALVKGGKRLPTGHVYAEGDTSYRYLQTTDFINKQLIYGALHYLPAKTFRVLERYEIADGDVFISIAGVNLGVAGVFRPDFEDRTILTENAARIHIVTDELPEYLALQLNGTTVQRQILENKGIGAGVPKLALFRIQQFLIPWPSKEEQLQIVRRLQAFNSSMHKEKDELGKIRFLKTALMQDLLKGRKRVTALMKETDVTSI